MARADRMAGADRQVNGQYVEGRQGGVLWLLSKADGRKTAEWKLDSPPIYDGLAIAGSRLYWSGTDGRIRCWAEGSE